MTHIPKKIHSSCCLVRAKATRRDPIKMNMAMCCAWDYRCADSSSWMCGWKRLLHWCFWTLYSADWKIYGVWQIDQSCYSTYNKLDMRALWMEQMHSCIYWISKWMYVEGEVWAQSNQTTFLKSLVLEKKLT